MTVVRRYFPVSNGHPGAEETNGSVARVAQKNGCRDAE
jgi:hypothetical protein